VAESLPLVPALALAELAVPERNLGLWRYGAAIPVDGSVGRRLSMGEGLTPLIDGGLDGVHVKLEFLSPTGSFKDRGAVVLVVSALERGAETLVVDSSGNAGSAIAAYAARAGLPCRVFAPESTSAGKQAAIRGFGAELELVPGDRMASAHRALAEVRRSGAFHASHVYDPHFHQGTKTFAYEVWEQLGGAPQAVIVPAGNGTLLLGAAIGFAELHAAGLIERQPSLIAVQAARCAPLAEAWGAGSADPAEVAATTTAAEGIAIARPARGAEMLAAVRATGGCVLAVAEDAIAAARSDLARRGLLVEPTAAVAWAAALGLRGGDDAPDPSWRHARLLASGPTIVPLTGSGLKAG
jgi:threonine synthase